MLTDFEDNLPAPPIGWGGRCMIAIGCLLGVLALAQAVFNLVGYAAAGIKWLA